MNHANANYMGIPLLDTDDNIQIMEMNDREFHARVYGTENTPYRATLEELIGYQDVDYIFGIKWYMCICGHQFQHPTECSDHLKTHQHIFYIKTHINSSLFLRHRWQIVCEQIRAPDTDTYDEFYVDTDTDDYSEEETDNEQSFSRTIDTDNDPPENQCNICLQTSHLFVFCDNMHKICSSCFVSIKQTKYPNPPICPYCRVAYNPDIDNDIRHISGRPFLRNHEGLNYQ